MSEPKIAPIMDNEHIKELLSIMRENGKDTGELTILLNYVASMENQLNKAANELQSMKHELNNIREERDHPIRTAMQNAANSLEITINNTRSRLDDIKSKIIDGCKSAVDACKQAGISALNGAAQFLRIKPALESLRKNLQNGITKDNKAIAKIEAVSAEYHAAGRHITNLGRVLRGKEPLADIKPNGKLAKLAQAPFRFESICLSNVLVEVKNAIASFERLEKSASKRNITERDSYGSENPSAMERPGIEKIPIALKRGDIGEKPSVLEHMKTLKDNLEQGKIDVPAAKKAKTAGVDL